MKQTFYYAIALTVMMAMGTNSHAASWRVNNDTTRGAQFANINAAMSSEEVQDGDTLYLDPGSLITGNQNVTKCVTIIGNGYFSNALPYALATIGGTLYLKAAHSKVYGVNFNSSVLVCADYVTIERCKTNHIGYSSGTARYAIIRNCYINVGGTCINGAGSSDERTFSWTIENNIILCNTYSRVGVEELYSPIIRNNVIHLSSTSSSNYEPIRYSTNATITNNILLNRGKQNQIFYSLVNCTVHHNVLSCAAGTYAEYPNNLCLGTTDFSTLFTMTGGNDEDYRLAENSPAKGYADFGGDCGPFDGPYPYVFGGMPLGVPYYTNAVIGSIAHDGKVNVSLKAIIKDE